jgi:hypothetical protein
MGGDNLITRVVMHYAADGGLEIVQWLVKNYEKTIFDPESELADKLLVDAILSDHIDIVEWLMDSYNLTTQGKSPFYYAVGYGDLILSTARWFLDRLSTSDQQKEFLKAIENSEWVVATFFIEVAKVNIDETYLWKSVSWSKLAKDESEDTVLFLRALLPRIDFPSHVSDVLLNTSSRSEDGNEIYLHRQLIIDGMRVRKKVKTLYNSRTRYVENLKIPEAVKKFNLLNSFLSDNQMGLSTETMWKSIQE